MGWFILKTASSDSIAPDHSGIAIRVNSCP